MRRSPASHQPPPPSKRTQSTAAPLHGEGGQRRRRTAEPRHTAGCGPRPCPSPAAARPSTTAPHDTSPANNNKAVGKEDILSSRCSKDVTTYQHRPRARPGRPCPVPAVSGQPLPGERRLCIREQSFSTVGRVLFAAGRSWGGEPAHRRVVGRASLCLPTVRSRTCVDAWVGAVSCGSFRTVAPVAVWGLGLLLREHCWITETLLTMRTLRVVRS
jgi:hypothetical protein